MHSKDFCLLFGALTVKETLLHLFFLVFGHRGKNEVRVTVSDYYYSLKNEQTQFCSKVAQRKQIIKTTLLLKRKQNHFE